MLQQEVMCTGKLKAVLQVMLSHHSSALHLGSQSAACHQAFPRAKGTVQS